MQPPLSSQARPLPFGTLPQPPARPLNGHLQDWALRPIPLIEQGAALARAAGRDLFALRLGLPSVVGFSPEWNKRVLTDPHTFVSRGGFSQLVPYLAGGLILTDAPQHKQRRRVINPAFDKKSVLAMQQRTRAAFVGVPQGQFDALAWADQVVLDLLNAAYFSGRFDRHLLHAFLAPLRQPFPVPALPRPLLFARVEAELRRLAAEPKDDLLGALAPLAGGLTEARVSLGAAHDTTTHILAYVLWHLAQYPQWHAAAQHDPVHHEWVLKETLRLYPAGWMGSRRLARAIDWQGVALPRGALILYSPYLSARHPDLWPQPSTFDPSRWQHKPPAWAYLPFGGGERLCLGMHLAQMLILDVMAQLPPLRAVGGNPQCVSGVTLGPKGPLWLTRN